ncbi:hypothetical protein K504DRAFT_467518 [Pleomassaria siparia CBS 279.74]|uniref:Uncharacterized protein n=1 Tax=Pleomassaria siparia CBS 279.74 TaxID=1314801 RepID=A0A6G1KA97_9PLEO|nr:hypothetical protein K504DRAFT_467518 [Pleomassaria siparia CBS 279.74]
MTMVANASPPAERDRKRSKPDIPTDPDARPTSTFADGPSDRCSQPHLGAQSRRNTKNNKSQGKTNKFGGPVSIPSDKVEVGDDDTDVDDARKGRDPPSTLDKWPFKDGRGLAGPVQPTYGIHGGHNDYKKYMNKIREQKGQKQQAESTRLRARLLQRGSISGPSTLRDHNSKSIKSGLQIADAFKKHGFPHEEYNGANDGVSMNGHIAKPGGIIARLRGGSGDLTAPSSGSELSEQSAAQTMETLYIQKQYVATPTAVPSKNILNKHILDTSVAGELWDLNQTSSPLLRLPEAVRSRVFGLALGGNTISIHFRTWKEFVMNGRPSLAPHFKYHATVYNGHVNPYALTGPEAKVSEGYTLLNGVCRQLYLETNILPYRFNTWGFESSLTMWNFLVVERTLSQAQRKGIREVVVKRDLPEKNLMEFMGGLERGLLVLAFDHEYGVRPKGWYRAEKTGRGLEWVKQDPY